MTNAGSEQPPAGKQRSVWVAGNQRAHTVFSKDADRHDSALPVPTAFLTDWHLGIQRRRCD